MTTKNNLINNEQKPFFQSLKGQLLVAMPGIDDLRFNKTVIYIYEHTQEFGAHGIIINKPAHKMSFNDILEQNGVLVEFFDKRFVTLMFSCNTKIYEISRLEDILINIPRLEPLLVPECEFCPVPRRAMSIREAILSKSERVHINDAFGRVLASPTVSCPPCVSIVVCGEVIDEQAQMALSFYGFEYVYVVK